ncbi:OmpP1/FadL family transporter [Lacinutrix sp. Bg11-31]|uniref:OmpP1/FadL family transporter n=1 Tax=Lacinutrix sp. Bg11-31 TaxID=2057808 RepID=UPI000C30CD26|nr:outer membrane protein transport protein [Lacinutrix sp. Bg11-31]AUC82233.1 transporter [Lacinutrix sp. Bg11-31]
MKKGIFLFIGVMSMFTISAQDISDALSYSSGEIIGSARYRALSGAFGALGGDLSAVSVNPAGSAIYTNSFASVSLNVSDVDNETAYFGRRNASSDSDLSLNQGGGVFVFESRNENSLWRKFALSVAFDNTKNYDDNWKSRGVNTTSIDQYFLNNAQGLRLGDISALPGESSADAYAGIGSAYGYTYQQAYLGYDSYILEPVSDADDNTLYTSNIAAGNFDQEYTYAATGYNGKIAFNLGAQYGDDLYLGLNLNSHFLNYERSTFLYEQNNNTDSVINQVGFENNIITNGAGFSFQLGTIYKLSNEFRVGFTYDSPTWMTITEETSQYIETVRVDGSENVLQIVNPQVVNLFPDYNLQSPSKVTGSLAYIFGKQGLISFDYSRKDYSKTKFKPKSDAYFSAQNDIIANNLTAAATYKLGGEYKVDQFSFRGGYRFEESPYKNGKTVGDLNGYSLGLGYNFGNTKLDLTYDDYNQSKEYQLYSTGLTDAASIDANNSNITLTLGFRL